jgi:membrane protease subunit HflC
MRFLSLLALIPLAVVLLLVVNSSAYTVNRDEFVYVTQFGAHIATHDGLTDGGLHWKLPWPIQSVQRLDRRLQYFDLRETEMLTRAGRQADHDEKQSSIDKSITVVAYVCWRIADKDGVEWFIRRVGTPDRVETILGEQIHSQLAAEIGQRQLDDLISVEQGKVDRSMEALKGRVLDSVKDRARREYGIDLVDIRVRRTSHPWQVREEIFKRIRSERSKKAQEYQSEGDALAKRIESEAKAKADDLINKANAEADQLKKEADARAIDIRSEAYHKAEDFYRFLKKLTALQMALGNNRSVLLLSSQHELFELLRPPPADKGAGKPAAGTPTKPSPGEDRQ